MNLKSFPTTLASRRGLILGAGAAALWPLGSAMSQEAAGASGPPGPSRAPGPPPTPEQIAEQLPLNTTGLEHVSIWAPDVAEAGAFYGKVFNPALHKEKAPPLRYYVPLTLSDDPKPPLSYIAIGATNGRPVQIDHYCALVQGYNAPAMAARLKQDGVQSAGRFGMYPDADGLQLQLLGVPGGLAATTEPAARIAEGPPIVEPLGLDNVILQVSDLDHATAYYRKFFNGAVTRAGDRVWIDVSGTRLGLEKTPAAGNPVISSFCVRVKRFDRAQVSRKLEALGGQIVPTGKVDADVLRFKSPMGIAVDLKEMKA